MANSQAIKPVVLINGFDVPVASFKVSLNNIRFKPRAHFIDMIRIAMVAKELRAMTRTMMMRRTRGNN